MANDSYVCSFCDKKDKFTDNKDATNHGWKIIGWNVGENKPIVYCEECPNKKVKENKPSKVKKK